MNAQSSEVNGQPARNSVRAGRAKPSTAGLTTYELYVVASQVDDVVRSAGGWLFDRVMAGWAVKVLVPDACDLRPLTILGVSTVPFDTGFEALTQGPHTESLAVAASVFVDDARVRKSVTTAVQRGHTEVTVWGDRCPTELDRRLAQVQHRLSAAAHAFKAQALMAARSKAPAATTEAFLSCASWYPPADSDLMPVS